MEGMKTGVLFHSWRNGALRSKPVPWQQKEINILILLLEAKSIGFLYRPLKRGHSLGTENGDNVSSNRLCSVTLTLAYDLDTLPHMATAQLAPSMLQFLCKQSPLQAQREPPSIVSVKAGPLLASQIRRERVQKPQAPFLALTPRLLRADTTVFSQHNDIHCVQSLLKENGQWLVNGSATAHSS